MAVENVQDYPRPPALQQVPQRLVAKLAGRTILDTIRALRVLETHHAPTYYIPVSDIAPDVLIGRQGGRSFCEWKGRAHYYDLRVEDAYRAEAAWRYPKPSRSFAALTDHVAFYAHALEEAWVGAHRVTPQPGDFYGGWVTPNLRGFIKGAPGSEHW